jgi:predicted DCC family thiol-disulfide oxidoreductase YuxK
MAKEKRETLFSDIPLVSGFIRAFSIDYRTLALFRICLGAIILVDILLRSRDFTAFFTDQGIIPRQLALNWWPDNATMSLYFINGGAFFNAALVLITVILAIAVMVGYRTRLAVVLSWILIVSLHQRSSILSHGGDDLVRLLLFWSMFLPLGARFSFDAAMEKTEPYPNDAVFSVASAGILLQTLYVYWVGALLKTGEAWHLNHSAIFYALSSEEYATNAGRWVLQNMEPLLPSLTQFVYLIELFGPVFLLAPLLLLYQRLPILFLLVCLHIGILVTLNVGFFPFASITSLLLFIPSEVWQSIRQNWVDKRSEQVTVFYDEPCDFCLKTVKLLKVMLVLTRLKILPAQQDTRASRILADKNTWVVQNPDGEYLIEWAALAWLFSRSCLFFWLSKPLQWLNKLGIGERLYHLIGERRETLGLFTSCVLPWRHSTGKISWFNQLVALLSLLFILQINLHSVFGDKYIPALPKSLQMVKSSTGLWQKWDMFAPYPVDATNWPVFEGVTADDRRVDIFRQKFAAPTRDKPENILSEYTNHRWRKFHSRLYLKKFDYYRADYVKYECRRWNLDRPEEDHITIISLAMARELTRLGSGEETVSIEDMGTYSC